MCGRDRMTAKACLVVMAVAVFACGGSSELPIPKRSTREPCDWPDPPLAEAIIRATKLSHCLPTSVRRSGVALHAKLSAAGRVVAVDQPLTLCLTMTPDGKIEEPYTLDEKARSCLLRELKSWRFNTVATCRGNYAYVEVSETADDRRAQTFAPTGRCG